jgi:sulfur-carrier protein
MKVDILLYATFADLLPDARSGRPTAMELDDGTTITDVLNRLGIPLTAAKIIFVNGRHAQADHILHDGDRLAVFPPIAGG